MTNILFIVLVFLLLTTTFKEFTFIRVTLPESSTGQHDARDQSGRIRITIEASGTVYLGDAAVSLEELSQVLRRVQDKQAADVLLAADEELNHGRVVRVMELIRRAGIFRLSIETLSGSKVAVNSP